MTGGKREGCVVCEAGCVLSEAISAAQYSSRDGIIVSQQMNQQAMRMAIKLRLVEDSATPMSLVLLASLPCMYLAAWAEAHGFAIGQGWPFAAQA